MLQTLKVIWSVFKPNRRWVRRLMISDGPSEYIWRIDCKACDSKSFYIHLNKAECRPCRRTVDGQICGHHQYQCDVGITNE